MESLQAKSVLESHGIKPSLHRLKILEYLMAHKNHPTVETIYKDISGDIPTLSKTTIYNTLKTFLEKRVVQAITIEDNEVRFDATIDDHGHFKCLTCGNLYDVDLDADAFNVPTIDGHAISEKHFYFKGTCKECLS